MAIRGIRGATTVQADQPDLILIATRELFEAILNENPYLHPKDVASITFTMTNDLTSIFPAQAVRQMGWGMVPMICMQEIPVPVGLPRVIRALLHWNTEKLQIEINHVFLHEAMKLRPDLANTPTCLLDEKNKPSAIYQNSLGAPCKLSPQRRK